MHQLNSIKILFLCYKLKLMLAAFLSCITFPNYFPIVIYLFATLHSKIYIEKCAISDVMIHEDK